MFRSPPLLLSSSPPLLYVPMYMFLPTLLFLLLSSSPFLRLSFCAPLCLLFFLLIFSLGKNLLLIVLSFVQQQL
jgi:hypothetical protein